MDLFEEHDNFTIFKKVYKVGTKINTGIINKVQAKIDKSRTAKGKNTKGKFSKVTKTILNPLSLIGKKKREKKAAAKAAEQQVLKEAQIKKPVQQLTTKEPLTWLDVFNIFE